MPWHHATLLLDPILLHTEWSIIHSMMLLGMLTQCEKEAEGACSGADIPAQRPDLRLSAAAQCQGDRTAVWPDYLLQVSCYFHA